MARTYKRDSNGRFAGGGGGSGGGGKSRPATKQLQRGANRLTRDNAGRITSVGGSGATAYGGRIRTASGKRRATTVAKGIGKAPKGTIGKARGLKADKNELTKAQGTAKAVKATERQRNIRSFMDQNRGATARDLKRDAQAFRTPLGKKDKKPGGPKTVGGALKELASKSRSRTAMGTGLTGDERRKAERLIGDNNVKGYRIVRGQRGDYVEAVSGVSSKAASLAEAAVSRRQNQMQPWSTPP